MLSTSHSFDTFLNFDFSSSVVEYDFTGKALGDIHKIVTEAKKQDTEPGDILHFLLDQLKLVSFGEYLKRYIYKRVQFDRPFSKVELSDYVDTLLLSFKENHAPISFGEQTTSPRKQLSRWLTQQSVRRDVVMRLGFGLRMQPEEVSDFLKKALLEEDFNDYDPEEVIYRYCFSQSLPYARALEYIALYESYPQKGRAVLKQPFGKICQSRRFKLDPEGCLIKYLKALKIHTAPENDRIKKEFTELYQAVAEHIALLHREASVPYSTHVREEDISPVDIERELYAGIPRNKDGNLRRSTLSPLVSHLNYQILSRQRLEKLLSGKYPVRRSDLITLCFYLHGDTRRENRDCKHRFLVFVKDINGRLERCGMQPIYPANPYEAFVMICFFSELPLVTYADVLELSFTENEE